MMRVANCLNNLVVGFFKFHNIENETQALATRLKHKCRKRQCRSGVCIGQVAQLPDAAVHPGPMSRSCAT
jgi:hypothetical protein